MRIFLILFGLFAVGAVIFNIMTYDDEYGSLDGFVYLEKDEGKVLPLKELTVFLILGKIESEYMFMENEYQETISPLENKVSSLEKLYEKIQGNVEQAVLEQRSSINSPNPRLNALRERRDSLYFEYKQVKEKYTQLQKAYNARMAQLINKYSAMQTETNQKGYFNFEKTKKRKYYIFAERRSFIDRYIWFVPFEVTGKGHRVNLSRANLTFVFK